MKKTMTMLFVSAWLAGAVMAEDAAGAREGHQLHLFLIAGLKAHRRASRNVEPHAARGSTIELQGTVGLKKMVVRAHLDRPVAAVRHRKGMRPALDIERNVAAKREDFSRNHAVLTELENGL